MSHTDPITADDLEMLLLEHDGPCISIHMPTSRILQETQQDRIRLKNFRGEAFTRLMEDHGLRRPKSRT